MVQLPKTREEWLQALDSLPSAPAKIPAFFFAHGSPLLCFPPSELDGSNDILANNGPLSPLANFLRDFGPRLLEKYKPKGIVVFSAHFESDDVSLVTDYGSENPLLMDYFGFAHAMYELKFKSKGDAALSRRVVEVLVEGDKKARLTPKSEQRGQDGRGFLGPGLDHGVFCPFILMFGNELLDVPIVEVSIDASLDPEKNWKLGKAISKLREEGILILSGGLTLHNMRDRSCFSERTAKPVFKEFNQAVCDALSPSEPAKQKQAMLNLTRHPGFRAGHPREEHFIPMYVAAGAGEGGDTKILCGLYGQQTVAFGV